MRDWGNRAVVGSVIMLVTAMDAWYHRYPEESYEMRLRTVYPQSKRRGIHLLLSSSFVQGCVDIKPVGYCWYLVLLCRKKSQVRKCLGSG